jgi:phosphohistidine swiveling domain-containing protein
MKLKLFEYAVLLHPEEDKDGKVIGKTEVIKLPSVLLAKDEKQVGILVAREIPKEHIDTLDRVEIIVRPF